jgi:hypothetical protein
LSVVGRGIRGERIVAVRSITIRGFSGHLLGRSASTRDVNDAFNAGLWDVQDSSFTKVGGFDNRTIIRVTTRGKVDRFGDVTIRDGVWSLFDFRTVQSFGLTSD